VSGDILIVVLAIAAAWSMGHHYAGAVVGPAYGAHAVKMYAGIALAGIFVILGALVTPVVATYVMLAPLTGIYADVALFSLVVMTNVTTYLKVPTSTIQL
jgi:PiT family inorganic phosphate transporter